MTFASKITVTRICLVPVFAILAVAYDRSVKSGAPMESLRWWAIGVFVSAAASDGLDGWVARRFNQISKFGAFIDPIADKALLLTGVVTLALIDWGQPGWRLPWWFAAVVVLRDCMILGGIRYLHAHRKQVDIVPHWSGKFTTAAQMIALGWVMLGLGHVDPFWPCLAATIMTLWSGWEYFHQGLRILRREVA